MVDDDVAGVGHAERLFAPVAGDPFAEAHITQDDVGLAAERDAAP